MAKFGLFLAALGLILFLAVSVIFPFKKDLFSNLYPKPASFAATDKEFTGSSLLKETSCLENQYIKICFDDDLGGTISSLYDKLDNPTQNLVLPTMGGAFQVDFRSVDPITFCPNKSGWGPVWNPTQAGSEGSFTSDGGKTWWNIASDTSNRSLSSTKYHIEIHPRNFYHDNKGDCHTNLPYTTAEPSPEDIYLTEDVELINDYVKVNWLVNHKGGDTHVTNQSLGYRQELPTLYVNDAIHECYHLRNGTEPTDVPSPGVVDVSFPCPTNSLGGQTDRPFPLSWFSFYNPGGKHEKMTIIGHTDIANNLRGLGTFRNYDKISGGPNTWGMQLDFSYYFNITPNMSFNTTAYITPHLDGDKMVDGTFVRDFINNIQSIPKDMQSGTITLPNLLTTGYLLNGTVIDMKNNTIHASDQAVQWVGSLTTPAAVGFYKLKGQTSTGGSIQADIYIPGSDGKPLYQSTVKPDTSFYISGKQYFAVIERAQATPNASNTFTGVSLYRSDQKVAWFGSALSDAHGTYHTYGSSTGDGVIQVDVYNAGSYKRTVTVPSTNLTINKDEYFAVIERANSGTVSFASVLVL